MRFLWLLAAMVLGGVTVFADAKGPFPVPGKPEDMGKGIQRTMSLLAKSTPTHHNTVKVLVYGQSISEQKWWELVRDDLKKRFPDADLVMENRAIGGFASQLLVNTVQHDVYTFYPDLVIFHVYGADEQYRQIIGGIRKNTAAEVLIQKDHIAANWPDPKATPQTNKGAWWDNYMNDMVLPSTAEKYQCGIVDIRSAWMKYLKDNNLQPPALLRDGVHLNDDGCVVMAAFIDQYLVYRPELPADSTLVRDIPVSADQWKGGDLTMPFEGNRVDIVAAAGTGQADVLDRRQEAIRASRVLLHPAAGPAAWSAPVVLTRVDHEKPLLPETWTFTITKVHADGKGFDYEVVGTKTGADGAGSTKTIFHSNSGRAIIDPSWFFRSDRNGPIAAGAKMTWEVVGILADAYAVPANGRDPRADRDNRAGPGKQTAHPDAAQHQWRGRAVEGHPGV